MIDDNTSAEHQTDVNESEEVKPDETLKTDVLEKDANSEEGKAENEPDKNESDEVYVTIGDEEAPSSESPAPAWVKELRKSHREITSENARLKKEIESFNQTKQSQETINLGEKPRFENFDYDEAKYERALQEWYDKKHRIDSQKAEMQARQQAELDAWNQKLHNYNESKKSLKFDDIDESEELVQSFLNVTQQGIIVQGAKNPALLVHALGNNPNKLQQLAQLKDPVQFAFEVAKIEANLKMKSRKANTTPEKKFETANSGTKDSTIENLRANAEKTGDYSAVIEYNRNLRRKAQ